MEHGTLRFQDFDVYLNVDDFIPFIEQEYKALDKELTDSDQMRNVKVRNFEPGVCLTFDFERVRGFGMRKRNIYTIEAAIRDYVSRFPQWTNIEVEPVKDKKEQETASEDLHPLVKIKNRVDQAIDTGNFEHAREMLDLYNTYRDTFGA